MKMKRKPMQKGATFRAAFDHGTAGQGPRLSRQDAESGWPDPCRRLHQGIDVDGHQRLGRADALPVFQPGHALLSTPIGADHYEIGRASCRERV